MSRFLAHYLPSAAAPPENRTWQAQMIQGTVNRHGMPQAQVMRFAPPRDDGVVLPDHIYPVVIVTPEFPNYMEV